MAVFPALQPYIDRGLLFSLLQQDALAAATDALGAHRWDADMTQGTLTFTSEQDPSRRLTAGATLLASIAPGPRSVLWGWGHPQSTLPERIAELRDTGGRDGVPDLANAEVPFPARFDGGDDGIAALAHELGQTAAGVLHRGPYYSAPVEGGTRFVFLLDAPLPPLTLATTVQKLPRLFTATPFRDARTSVWGLASATGWQFAWTDAAFHGAEVSDGLTTTRFGFDDAGRLTGAQTVS